MKRKDQFAVAFVAVLLFFSWFMALSRLIGIHFWDKQYALEYYQQHQKDEMFANSTALHDIGSSYFHENRYVFLLPHIVGAILWWNLYFLQLVPQVRHAYGKKIHRWLGRLLMVVAVVQVWSGAGLALTTHSNIIKLVSLVLAVAVMYCICQAVRYAIARDIPRHKEWALRLVGYMHTIALQRVYMFALIVSHQMGWYGLYPDLTNATPEEGYKVVVSLFDDSFVLCILTAFLLTEWYLADEKGMMDKPHKPFPTDKLPHQFQPINDVGVAATGGSQPLLSTGK